MRILIDTHIFLWLVDDDKRLSDKYRLIMAQALEYNLTLMTEDKAILVYPEIKLL